MGRAVLKRRWTACGASVFAAAVACRAVPEISYADADADPIEAAEENPLPDPTQTEQVPSDDDASHEPPDGGSAPPKDASAPPRDATTTPSCPTAPPPGATACCGNIACVGTCDVSGCSACAADCSGSPLCCNKKGPGKKAICKQSLSDKCPP